MQFHVSKSVCRVLALAMVALLPVAAAAQDAAKPAASPASRWDIFAGYSYLSPSATVQVQQPNGTTLPVDFNSDNAGVIMSGAYYFNRYLGAQLEGSSHDTWVDNASSNNGITTLGGGLIARYPTSDLTPFAHALVGASYVGGPQHEPYTWGPAITLGLGVDYETPLFHHRLAFRLFQADYQYIHENFGIGVWKGTANIDAARISAGVVIHGGMIGLPPAVTLACSAAPSSVFPGDPITITATAGSLDPKASTVYSWSGAGASGTGSSVTIQTGTLAAGTYTVSGTVKQGKPGHEGMKPGESASCSASFTVKAFEPPTVSCTASPSTIKPGGTSTITASGVSPQNRPLTFAYSATAGTITGNGASATWDSTGAPTGTSEVTCKVTDDKNQSATSTTTVTIIPNPLPPMPHASLSCTTSFSKDKKRPTRVDNEAKACLDDLASQLASQPSAKAVVVGEATDKEGEMAHAKKHAQWIAAERAVDTKEYLVVDKGIEASRIGVATGTGKGQVVEDYLVPAGADFNADFPGTTPVDETKVKPVPRKALGEKHHHKKAM